MSEPQLRGVAGRLAALALLLAAAVPPAATADVLDDLRGRWAASADGTGGDGVDRERRWFRAELDPVGRSADGDQFSSAGRPGSMPVPPRPAGR